MRVSVALLALAGVLGLASCGGNPPPPAQSGTARLDDSHSRDSSAASGGSGIHASANLQSNGLGLTTHAPSAPRREGEAPPPGAQYTLFCAAVQGPAHVERAVAFRDALVRQTHLQNWHLIHTDQQSSIYFGYYRTFDNKALDPKEVDRAQADLRRLSDLKAPNGDKLFENCLFVPINDPDPDAPAQWNLVNAPADAFWSIQICAYEGSTDRKKYAVDAVRELRAKKIPAYYYHGETISSVCVGVWPRSAVKEQGIGVTADGRARDDAHADNPDRPVLVMPDILPANSGPLYDRQGNRVQVETPKLEILDPSLLQAFKTYPYHMVNGDYHFRLVKGQKIWDPSLLVQIPNREQSAPVARGADDAPAHVTRNAADVAADAITGSDSLTGADAKAGNNASAGSDGTNVPDDAARRPTEPTPGTGKLRSIDQH